MSNQLSAAFGGPIGAFIMAGFGIAAAAMLNSAMFALMFVLLMVIRPRNSFAPVPTADSQLPIAEPRLVQDAVDGLRISMKGARLRPSMVMLIGCAAFLLPVLGLILPILARQEGWEQASVGLIYGVSAGMAAAVALGVIITGGFKRPGIAGGCGLFAAAIGILGLIVLPAQGSLSGRVLLLGSGAFIGLGAGLFSTHIRPLVLGRTPKTHIGRVQAIVAIAQSVPLLITNFSLGSVAQFAGAKVALLICAASLVAIAALALRSTQLRQAKTL